MEWMYRNIKTDFFVLIVKTCKAISQPRFGFIVPPACAENPKYGTNCTVACIPGFKMSTNSTRTSCTATGEWNVDPNDLGICLGIYHSPMFCKKHFIVKFLLKIIAHSLYDTMNQEHSYKCTKTMTFYCYF